MNLICVSLGIVSEHGGYDMSTIFLIGLGAIAVLWVIAMLIQSADKKRRDTLIRKRQEEKKKEEEKESRSPFKGS